MLRGMLQVVGLLQRSANGGERPRTLRCGGLHWHVLPAGDELFGDAGPDLDGWRREAIKAGLQRTIERADLPGGAVAVKRSRVNGPRAWWREVFRGSKSELEFENARALRARGLAAVEPLAWARAHPFFPSQSVYLSRFTDAAPLQDYLEREFAANPLGVAGAGAQRSPGVGDGGSSGASQSLQPRPPEGCHVIDRRTLARELGRALARMHDAGVAHPDPHPGNLLVSFEGDRPTFALIDLHAIRIGAPLPWNESLDNLVLFNRYFQLRATRTDRLAFWQAYVAARSTLPTSNSAAMAKDVERRTALSNARFWNRRLDRYQKTNRQYRRVPGGHSVKELPDEFVKSLIADPDAPFRDPSAKVLKDSRSSTVIELAVPGMEVAIYKRFRIKSPTILLKNLLRTSSAMRSWSYGHNLLDRGLPTARPLLVLHRRRHGCPAEGYLLTERVPDARELSAAVAAGPHRAWADSLGRLIRMMHDNQVAHRDLKAPNILMSGVGADAVPVLIDLVGVVPGKPVSRGLRMRNLARLNASFVNASTVTRTDRLRFLRAYLAWGLHGPAGWKDWWNGVAQATEAKVAKNVRSGRPLA